MINPAAKQDRALLAIAMADYANASEQILAGSKYDDIFSGVSDKQTIFQSKSLETARKFNSKALDKEDEFFAKPHALNSCLCQVHWPAFFQEVA